MLRLTVLQLHLQSNYHSTSGHTTLSKSMIRAFVVLLFEVPIFHSKNFGTKVIFHIQFNQNRELISCTVFNHFIEEHFSIFWNTHVINKTFWRFWHSGGFSNNLHKTGSVAHSNHFVAEGCNFWNLILYYPLLERVCFQIMQVEDCY